MKHLISTTLLLITFLSSSLNAQQISLANYNKEFIHEDFNQEGEHFKTVTTTDNSFTLDKGDYFLSRNNNESEYAIIANNSSVSNFILKTAVRLGPSNNKKASIGIVLKAQQDGKGAIIFEINKKGEYRIKQLLGNTYKTLSGNSKYEGWVKNKIINKVDEHNFIEIRTENNIYDVYINSDYLTTFYLANYSNGSCGLIISPETKARIAYFHVNTKGDNTNTTTSYAHENSNNTNTRTEGLENIITKNADLATVTIEQQKEIVSLKSEITDLKSTSSSSTNKQQTKKIDDLKQQVTIEKLVSTKIKNDLNKLNKSSNSKITKLTNEITTLKTQLKTTTNINTSLNRDLSTKLKTKKHDDIVNDLNSQLSLLKNKQLELNTEVQALNTKISNLETTNIELKELFILKDFEMNGIKPSELTKQTNTYPVPKEIKGTSTIYAVQFGVFMQAQAHSTLKILDDVWYETTEHGTYVYLSGEFKNPKEATAHKNKVAALGYPNAFVVTLTK